MHDLLKNRLLGFEKWKNGGMEGWKNGVVQLWRIGGSKRTSYGRWSGRIVDIHGD